MFMYLMMVNRIRSEAILRVYRLTNNQSKNKSIPCGLLLFLFIKLNIQFTVAR